MFVGMRTVSPVSAELSRPEACSSVFMKGWPTRAVRRKLMWSGDWCPHYAGRTFRSIAVALPLPPQMPGSRGLRVD